MLISVQHQIVITCAVVYSTILRCFYFRWKWMTHMNTWVNKLSKILYNSSTVHIIAKRSNVTEVLLCFSSFKKNGANGLNTKWLNTNFLFLFLLIDFGLCLHFAGVLVTPVSMRWYLQAIQVLLNCTSTHAITRRFESRGDARRPDQPSIRTFFVHGGTGEDKPEPYKRTLSSLFLQTPWAGHTWVGPVLTGSCRLTGIHGRSAPGASVLSQVMLLVATSRDSLVADRRACSHQGLL